jgi:hydroxyethylthiazole kinase-like uncharacterized protein yjeF
MMRRAFAVEDVRRLEGAAMAQLPNAALMERAAAGLTSVLIDLLGGAYGARVVLLVGSGDNGGDALLAGARMARRGARVDALLLAQNVHQHAKTLDAAGGRLHVVAASGALSGAASRALARADVVIDGIVGIGGRGGLREPAASVVEQVPSSALVVAVDVPSGVEVDTGEVLGDAVVADVTVAMGVRKVGLLVDPAAAHAGQVVVVDLPLDESAAGALLEQLDDADAEALVGSRRRNADKYAEGVVGIVAGSEQYAGAAVLTAAGAVHGGSGYTRFVGRGAVVDAVRAAFPEVVAMTRGATQPWSEALSATGRVQSWVVGPGLGTDDDGAEAVTAVLAQDVPALLDADALTLLAEREDLRAQVVSREAPTVLTPHAGELARLLTSARGSDVARADVEAQRLAHVREAVAALKAVVLLKGSTTLIAAPDPSLPMRVVTTGGPWLASAGTGDVLSGFIGTLLARGLDPIDAASAGAHRHGLAGRQASEAAGDRPRALLVAQRLTG